MVEGHHRGDEMKLKVIPLLLLLATLMLLLAACGGGYSISAVYSPWHLSKLSLAATPYSFNLAGFGVLIPFITLSVRGLHVVR
jgi:hypothetical protein